MAAGTHYDLNPVFVPEELYRVETGVRKSGPWALDATNIEPGTILPAFTPVAADLKKRKLVPVRNVKVVEAYTTGDGNLTLKVAKNPLVYRGMFLGNGKKGAEVASVDRTGRDHDVVTLKAAFGENLAAGTVLFEATAAQGTVKKDTANFVLFDAKRVTGQGTELCTLLMQAYEVKEDKLPIPIHELDKQGLTSRFQFE